MLSFYSLLISFLCAQQPEIAISTDNLLLNSLYDIPYLERVSTIFFSSQTIQKTTNTLSVLLSLKYENYTRSDIYAFLSCVFQKGIDISKLQIKNIKGFSLINFLKTHNCSYLELKSKAYLFLENNSNLFKDEDLKLLEKIVDVYFKDNSK